MGVLLPCCPFPFYLRLGCPRTVESACVLARGSRKASMKWIVVALPGIRIPKPVRERSRRCGQQFRHGPMLLQLKRSSEQEKALQQFISDERFGNSV